MLKIDWGIVYGRCLLRPRESRRSKQRPYDCPVIFLLCNSQRAPLRLSIALPSPRLLFAYASLRPCHQQHGQTAQNGKPTHQWQHSAIVALADNRAKAHGD